MAWTTPRTWVALETVTAALLNTHLRDNLNALGTWTSYTPTWTAASVNPTIGNGTRVGRYISVGKTVIFEIQFTMGNTTSFGTGAYSIALPVAAARQDLTFHGSIRDVGSSNSYPIKGELTGSATTMILRQWSTTAGNQFASVGPSTPFTFANTDIISISGTYEAA